MTPILTYPQAAEFLGIPVGSLYALVNRKEISHLRLGKRWVRFRQDDLIKWLNEKSVSVNRPSGSDK